MDEDQRCLEEVRQLYMKLCESFLIWQEETDIKDAKFAQLKSLSDELEQKIDCLISTTKPNSAKQVWFKIMKVYVWIVAIEWTFVDPNQHDTCRDLCAKVLALLEPFSYDSMNVYPYLFTLRKTALLHRGDRIGGAADMKCSILVCQIKNDSDLSHAAWDGAKTFGIPPALATIEFRRYLESRNIKALMAESSKTASVCIFDQDKGIGVRNENTTNAEPILSLGEFARLLKSADLRENFEAFEGLLPMLEHYLEQCQLKQARHLLSVAMHHLVTIRRGLEPEERHNIDRLQGVVSNLFAFYGVGVANGSYAKMENHPSFKTTRNEDFIALTQLVEEGVEEYESQFPVEFVDTYSELMKILKRAKAWNKRGLEMTTDSDQEEHGMTALKTSIEGMMSMLAAENKAKLV